MPNAWRLSEGAVTFTWDLWYGCSYRCPYCWWELEGLWEKLAKQHRILPPAEWLAVWERIRAAHGDVRIDILGGEPLLYPRCDELLEGLSGLHFVQATTSLALPLDRLEALLGRLSPERVHFNASFHPDFTSLDDFLARLLRLKDRGFEPGALVVTWPPYLERLSAWSEAFRSRGIPFTPMVFQGRWQGRDYPESFTPQEKARIASLMNDTSVKDDEVRYRLERRSTKGKLCHAGRVYANVKADGTVYRCGQDAFGQKPLGSIFDPRFRLPAQAQPCPYESCSCSEFRFLDEVGAFGRGAAS
ncbi:MAG: radical SAM protein [Elusimicrobia bacterium]|nr:radical SAM protein [Elusimicrobiota bacterium]